MLNNLLSPSPAWAAEMASIVRAVVAATAKNITDCEFLIDLSSSNSVVLIIADQLKLNIRSQDQW